MLYSDDRPWTSSELTLLADLFETCVSGTAAAAGAALLELVGGPGRRVKDHAFPPRRAQPANRHRRAVLAAQQALVRWAAQHTAQHGDGSDQARFAQRCVSALGGSFSRSTTERSLGDIFRDTLSYPWRWPAAEAAAAAIGVDPFERAAAGGLAAAAREIVVGARRVVLGTSPVACELRAPWALDETLVVAASLPREQSPLHKPDPAVDAAAAALVSVCPPMDLGARDPLWFGNLSAETVHRLVTGSCDADAGTLEVFAVLWQDEAARLVAERRRAFFGDGSVSLGRPAAQLVAVADAATARYS